MRDTTMLQYVVKVFGDGSLAAAHLMQLSNTSLEWFIFEYHNAIYYRCKKSHGMWNSTYITD